jgi:hypothetical protein
VPSGAQTVHWQRDKWILKQSARLRYGDAEKQQMPDFVTFSPSSD